MAAIARRGLVSPISRQMTLATADDVNGVADATQTFDVTGASRVVIVQLNSGTAGTAGIDVVEISHDEGENWEAADDVLALDSDDHTGTVLAAGALNAAGVEPAGAAVFKCGPYEGPTQLRVSRGAQGTGTAWVTGAPAVIGFAIGSTGGAIAAEA